MKPAGKWWRKPFEGKLRVIAWEVGLALLVVIAVADLPQSAQARLYGLLLSPIVFLVVLGALFLATRRKNG